MYTGNLYPDKRSCGPGRSCSVDSTTCEQMLGVSLQMGAYASPPSILQKKMQTYYTGGFTIGNSHLTRPLLFFPGFPENVIKVFFTVIWTGQRFFRISLYHCSKPDRSAACKGKHEYRAYPIFQIISHSGSFDTTIDIYRHKGSVE